MFGACAIEQATADHIRLEGPEVFGDVTFTRHVLALLLLVWTFEE